MNKIVLDTNILIYSKQSASPYHTTTTNKIVELSKAGNALILCPQVLREFHKVLTTPTTANGFGLKPEAAMLEIKNLESTYSLVLENSNQFDIWKSIVEKYSVSGKAVHDANIYAFMKSQSITDILTFNVKDFKRYQPDIIIHTI